MSGRVLERILEDDSDQSRRVRMLVEDPQIGVAEPGEAAPANTRLRDHGPRYTETPVDPYSPDAPTVAEPWNAVTAALFVAIAVTWLIRLRGHYRQYPFLVCCLPILLVGGVG